MKKLSGVIAMIGFYIFALVIGAWTVSLTLAELKEILPGDPITPYFALCLFDGGALAWLGVWLKHAKGLYQRAISIMMLIADLAGVLLISGGRILSGGQTLTDIPESLGAAIIYGVLIWTAINLIALYAFHVTDPATMEDIEMQVLEDTIQQEATEQARANVESEVKTLAGVMAARATGRLKYKLRLPISSYEIQALEGETIEQPPAQLQAPAKAPQILQAKQKRKINPLGLWIAKAAAAARAKVSPQPAMVTFEQTAPAPQVIEQTNPTQPATGQQNQSSDNPTQPPAPRGE